MNLYNINHYTWPFQTSNANIPIQLHPTSTCGIPLCNPPTGHGIRGPRSRQKYTGQLPQAGVASGTREEARISTYKNNVLTLALPARHYRSASYRFWVYCMRASLKFGVNKRRSVRNFIAAGVIDRPRTAKVLSALRANVNARAGLPRAAINSVREFFNIPRSIRGAWLCSTDAPY